MLSKRTAVRDSGLSRPSDNPAATSQFTNRLRIASRRHIHSWKWYNIMNGKIRFLGSSYILPNFRFARRWPKALPRGTLGEYAVSPRLGIRSPASLPPQHAPSLNNHSSTATHPFHQPNHDSTILRVESKNDFDSTVPHPQSLNRQHRATWPWLVHQLPRPPRHFLHHPQREGDLQSAGNGAVSATSFGAD